MRGRSLVLLLTDFYDTEGYAEGIRQLLAGRLEVNLIHVVARDELSPSLRGRFHLLDLETGRARDVTLLPQTVESYRRRFGEFCSGIAEFARTHELACARVVAEEPLERRVIDVLRAGGILTHR